MNGSLQAERHSYKISFRSYTAHDGAGIAARLFEPRGTARATLVFLHAAALNSQMYAPIGVRLASNFGVRAVLLDMRGHGESDGRRGHVEYIGQLEDDLHDVLSVIKHESPSLPVYVGAHCAGSTVLVRYAGIKGVTQPDGYVFVASLLVDYKRSGRKGAGEKTSHGDVQEVVSALHLRRLFFIDVLNRLGITAFNALPIVHYRFPQDVSRNAKSNVTSYSYSMFRQMNARGYYREFNNINRPLLMIIGDADAMVRPDDLRHVFDRHVPSGIDKTFKVLDKYDHFNIIWSAGREIGEWIAARNPVFAQATGMEVKQ